MKKINYSFILILSLTFFSVNCQKDQKLSILFKKGKYSIIFPEKMELAIKEFNSSFQSWRTNDYTSKVLKDLQEDNNPNIAPFALILDVNKDGIKDIILDGHDKRNSLLICVLSNGNDFKVMKIEENPLEIPKSIANYDDGKKEYGLNYYLLIPQQNDKSSSLSSHIFSVGIPQQSDAKGELLNDGGIIDYYYENGSFRSEYQPL